MTDALLLTIFCAFPNYSFPMKYITLHPQLPGKKIEVQRGEAHYLRTHESEYKS